MYISFFCFTKSTNSCEIFDIKFLQMNLEMWYELQSADKSKGPSQYNI